MKKIAKSIIAVVMLILGIVYVLHPAFDTTVGNIWMVGAVLLAWMPTNE